MLGNQKWMHCDNLVKWLAVGLLCLAGCQINVFIPSTEISTPTDEDGHVSTQDSGISEFHDEAGIYNEARIYDEAGADPGPDPVVVDAEDALFPDGENLDDSDIQQPEAPWIDPVPEKPVLPEKPGLPDVAWLKPQTCQQGWQVERHLSLPFAGLYDLSSFSEGVLPYAVGPKGYVVAVASGAGRVEIRDTTHHKQLFIIPPLHPKLLVSDLQFDPKEQSLAVAYNNGLITLYPLPSVKPVTLLNHSLNNFTATGALCVGGATCAASDEICFNESCYRGASLFLRQRDMKITFRSDGMQLGTCESQGNVAI